MNSGLGLAGIKPAASPVDTFVRTNEGDQLDQLARGLSVVAPAMGRFSDTLAQKRAEVDFETGIKTAREVAEKAKTAREAIQKGLIRPNESEWFMAGLHEQFGRLGADEFNFAFLTALATDEQMQTTTDPADFNRFYSEQRQKWESEHLTKEDRNLSFEKGFGSKADAYLADAQRSFAASLGNRVMQFSLDNHFAEVKNAVKVEMKRGLPLTEIGKAVTALNDDAIRRGVSGSLLNARTSEAVIAAAVELKDITILDILKDVKSGPALRSGERSPLSDTKFGSDKIEEARQLIALYNHQDAEAQTVAQKRQLDTAIDTTFTQFVAGAIPFEVAQANLVKLGQGDKVSTLINLHTAILDHSITDEPFLVANLARRVNSTLNGEIPTTITELSNALSAKRITTATYRTLINDVEEREKNGGVDPLAHDGFFKSVETQLYALFVSQFGFESQETKMRGGNARDQLYFDYLTWKKGPGKDVQSGDASAKAWAVNEKNMLFARFADVQNLKDVESVPPVNSGPTVIDPVKDRAGLPQDIEALAQEWEQIKEKKRHEFSSRSLFILRSAQIAPDAIEQFVTAQRRLMQASATNDSTTVR